MFQRIRRQFTTRGVALAGMLVALAAAAVPNAVTHAGTDPEPTVVEYPASNYDPGPGWPEGWAPPAAPAGLTDDVRAGWEDSKSLMPPPVPEHLDFRVLTPMPDWTEQYPYVWRHEFILCGNTAYAYFYPFPDTVLYRATHNVTLMVAKTVSRGCNFAPVEFITHVHELTPEELEQIRLSLKLGDDAEASRGGPPHLGGLVRCNLEREGTFENIPVCFNDGDASASFDVPAYLDVAVGRVRVPVRFVSELMGADVTWDQATWTVTITFPEESRMVVYPFSLPGYQPKDWFTPESLIPDRTETYDLEDRSVTQPRRVIRLTVNDNVALVDGKRVPLDAPPVLLPPGRVMIPVRFVAEQMGAKVYWVGEQPIFKWDGQLYGRNQVHIFTPFYPYCEYPSWSLENRAMKF
ncbi:MAG TPA: copper amine oxidase N-terminal domain-containing protein [Symbiobacteriaceae bacterium]|nr:copper amine oxidase N-terminal domain-containing protein [Symbiobacteriaceae bacterium]